MIDYDEKESENIFYIKTIDGDHFLDQFIGGMPQFVDDMKKAMPFYKFRSVVEDYILRHGMAGKCEVLEIPR